MVVKPIAFLVVAALVVMGAVAGAYLAVRHGRGPVSTPVDHAADEPSASVGTLRESAPADEETPEMVDVTEIAISEAPQGTPSQPIQRSSADVAARVDQSSRRGDTEAKAVPGLTAAPQTDRTSATAQQSTAGDLPHVEGWERRGRPSEPPVRAADADGAKAAPAQLALRAIEPAALGLAVAPEPRPPVLRELVIAADSVIGLQVDTPISTEQAKVEDSVEARVTRDVVVSNEVAIKAGTRVVGSVVLVEQAGQLRGASRLGVRFHTVVLDDIYELPIVTETVYREGKGRGGESAAKIGGAAVGGAILGAIFGGRQGAAIGGAAGAAGGTAAAAAGDGQPATLPAGSTLTIRLSRPASINVEY